MKKFTAFLFLTLCVFSTLFVVGCNKNKVANCTYEINAEYLDNGVIGGDLRFTYCCDIKDGTDTLKFNLFPNAFRDDAKITPLASVEKQYGEIEIVSVKRSGEALDFKICGADKNVLQVLLGELVCYNEKIVIDIEFGLVLPSGDYRFCKGEHTVNVGNWYPILCVHEEDGFVECEYSSIGDPFYSQVADYKIKLVVPSKMVVSASGKAVSTDVEGDKTAYSYELQNARDFAFCMSEKFNVLSEEVNGVTVNYYYFADVEPELTFKSAKNCLSYFSKTFGEYPYSTFSVAESNFNEGGMEYPGLVYVNYKLNTPNKLYTTVHETAHQWWYSAVGNNQLDEAYLDEGLTEYSTAIFFDENKEFKIDANAIFKSAKNACASYNGILKSMGEKADNTMVKKLSDFNGELEYVNVAYNRGMTMMKSAEDAVGRDKIKELLKKYYKNYTFKIATTEDFLHSMKPVESILKSYISGEATV